MAPKPKRMRETDHWELLALPLILPFHDATLFSSRVARKDTLQGNTRDPEVLKKEMWS